MGSTVALGFCSNITDAGVIALATHCPNLTEIGLRDCSDITDAGVVALATGCRNITYINICGCPEADTNAAKAMLRLAHKDIRIPTVTPRKRGGHTVVHAGEYGCGET